MNYYIWIKKPIIKYIKKQTSVVNRRKKQLIDINQKTIYNIVENWKP